MTKALTDQLMAATHSISRSLRQRMAAYKDSEGDANMLQIHSLVYIREHEGITMKEFAQYLKVTSPSATSFVNRLVKLGWVERFTDDTNRKLVRLRISKKGEGMILTKMKERTAALHQVVSLLPGRDQQELARILTSLAEALRRTS
jgi:DNA-binding MarR family transcriptional regulator